MKNVGLRKRGKIESLEDFMFQKRCFESTGHSAQIMEKINYSD